MTTRFIAILSAFGLIVSGLTLGYIVPVFAAPAVRDENNIPAVFGSSCETETSTVLSVGNQVGTVIQATTTRRAIVRISNASNATNTVSIRTNGAVALTPVSGLQIGSSTATVIPAFIDIGLNTTIPATGSIVAYTNNGSSTVNVYTCTY